MAVNKDELKKMLEDDFFGESDSDLSGLEDISLDLSMPPEEETIVATKEETLEEVEVADEFNLDDDSENSKDIFDLDNFDFDENVDLDLETIDANIGIENKSTLDEDFGTKELSEIIEKEEALEEELHEISGIVSQPMPNINEHEQEMIKDIVHNEVSFPDNSFTNEQQNDTINIIDNNPKVEDNKGFEMGKTTLNYDEFSDAMSQEYINVKKIDFPEVSNQITGEGFNVDLFSNIPVTIDVFLGNTTISLKDVHDLSKGSVIELDKFYGEPLDLKINGELIATGEVVAIDSNYGIMIKDIVKS